MPPEPPETRAPAPDFEVIDRSPLEPEPQDFDAEESERFIELVGDLAAENEQLRAEVERLQGKQTFDDVCAQMAQPYADKVFWFLVWYCLAVLGVLLLNGFKSTDFQISDVVLSIIAGSTAVSAIGLVGFVVNGLFGNKRP